MMSETEYHTGVIREIKLPETSKSFESQIEWLKNEGYNFIYVDIEEEFFESEECIKINDIWYKFIQKRKEEPYNDIVEATKLENGDISFTLKFYNGGTYLGEMLEKALGKL
jgi:hypothetical protein